jgi:hypothetical protein
MPQSIVPLPSRRLGIRVLRTGIFKLQAGLYRLSIRSFTQPIHLSHSIAPLTLPSSTPLLARFKKMPAPMLRLLGLFLLTALFITGCARDPRLREDTAYLGGFQRETQPQRANFDNVSFWDGDHVSGSPSIRIHLGEQRAYFYKGGELVGISVISSGREGFTTKTGNFKIIQKDRYHKSSLYGNYVDAATGAIVKKDIDTSKDKRPPGTVYDGADMPYFMRIVGGIGMHEGFLPGYPASHGCIRMPGFMAEKFFENVSLGTPVSLVH